MEATQAVRNVYKGTLIVKLSPNVTDIAQWARIVVDAGADSRFHWSILSWAWLSMLKRKISWAPSRVDYQVREINPLPCGWGCL